VVDIKFVCIVNPQATIC